MLVKKIVEMTKQGYVITFAEQDITRGALSIMVTRGSYKSGVFIVDSNIQEAELEQQLQGCVEVILKKMPKIGGTREGTITT